MLSKITGSKSSNITSDFNNNKGKNSLKKSLKK